jgi:hypothetical protein
MKLFLSEYFTGADVNFTDALRIVVVGAVCITAIIKCGIWAVVTIGSIKVIQLFTAILKEV